MTDQEHADAISAAVRQLNRTVWIAFLAGLTAEIEVIEERFIQGVVPIVHLSLSRRIFAQRDLDDENAVRADDKP